MQKLASQTLTRELVLQRYHPTLHINTKSPISRTKRSVSNGKKWLAVVPEIKKNQNSLCLTLTRLPTNQIMMEMI